MESSCNFEPSVIFDNSHNTDCSNEQCVSRKDSGFESENSGAVLCQYFLKGKCGFGDDCFNRHEVQPNENNTENTLQNSNKTEHNKSESHKQKNKSMNTEKEGKKPPMKTATDVINRIQWDKQLNPEDFIVGYLDRFLGILENSFNSFDWKDVTSLDQNVLAIPRHRIQYFKYRDEIVWDKKKRLDSVFGSTGSEITIVEVIKNYKQEIETINSDNSTVNTLCQEYR